MGEKNGHNVLYRENRIHSQLVYQYEKCELTVKHLNLMTVMGQGNLKWEIRSIF